MSKIHSEEKISEAWRLHRSGNNNSAIDMFRDILDKTPRNVDAWYGLGLARRGENDTEGAREAFQQGYDIARETLNAVDDTSAAEGHRGSNDLASYTDDRFLMLSRMLKQRLEELD